MLVYFVSHKLQLLISPSDDPEFPEFKANYRDFLQQTTKFHQPIPIRDATIQRKIHYTYRLQFLKDVVLARILDDSTFNVLNSCILFNQIDIIQHIQQEHSFLWDVVRLFVDEDMLNAPSVKRQAAPPQHMIISLGGEFNPADDSAMDVDPPIGPPSPKNNGVSPAALHTPLLISMASRKRSESYAFAPPEDMTPEDVNLRRQVILLLQQLCVMGKNVQLPARLALFRSLVDRGVLFAVQWAMGLPEVTEGDSPSINKPTISAGGEILSALLDHDLNGVRGHVLKQILAIEKEREMNKQGADKAETILEMVCKIMASSGDLAVQCQVGDALKVWLDIPPPEPSNPGGGEMVGIWQVFTQHASSHGMLTLQYMTGQRCRRETREWAPQGRPGNGAVYGVFLQAMRAHPSETAGGSPGVETGNR